MKNYLTPSGAKKLKDELHQLLSEERPKLVQTVSWAASNGDRSENADYIYGKRRLREIDRRIHFLTKRIESSEVVDPGLNTTPDRVCFGARVSVRDEEEKLRCYQIVGVDESDPAQGRISYVSPLGASLLNAHVGDLVRVLIPKGEEELEVVKIEYLLSAEKS